MDLVVVSGRSGSGKTTALHVLEDVGYYCVDNLPVGLLPALVDRLLNDAASRAAQKVAVGIDARNLAADLQRVPEILVALDRRGVDLEVLFLDAQSATLVKRFNETRRRHPLTDGTTTLREALDAERELLERIADLADLTIDTTNLSSAELADLVRTRVVADKGGGAALLFLSFAYRRGVPVDADLVFDARCLPNPYWVPELRSLTGRDAAVAAYLGDDPVARELLDDVRGLLRRWLPRFEASGRSYLTIAIGCTGGQHRSVYVAERLHELFATEAAHVLVRHRELARGLEARG
jgi:UPF0042 nucleotide-binding protein